MTGQIHVFSQSKNYGIGVQPRMGYLIAHRATMKHLLSQYAYGVELQGSILTNGTKQWHHDYNFPKITLGIVYSNLGNNKILGEVIGVLGGLNLPFFQEKGFRFGAIFNGGIGFITKKYDVKRNPKNNAIGSNLNCMVSAGLLVEKIWKQHAIGFEINMTHLSNGAIVLPNLGVNLPTVKLSYSYYFKPIDMTGEANGEIEGPSIKKWNFYTQLILSAKQIYPTGGHLYGIFGLTNFAQYRFSKKSIVETGVDFIYNQSIVPYNDVTYSFHKNMRLGIYGAYVLPIHRFHILLGMGGYVYKPLPPNGWVYLKFGARFRIIDRLWGNVTIKSHWAKADYFEYGLTFRW